MIMKDELTTNQLTVSPELILLLRWLAMRDEEKLKKMISKAVNAGLGKELQKISTSRDEILAAEDMQYTITDFFSLLETLLLESMHEQIAQNVKDKNLSFALEQIDSTVCDDETLRSTLEKASSKIDLNPEANPKEILYQELLKRWKPHNKAVIN